MAEAAPFPEMSPAAAASAVPIAQRKKGQRKKKEAEKRPEFAPFQKTGPLLKNDVTCRVCLSIMIEPVTFPCNHTTCKECFLTYVRDTSLNCPLCRLRLGVWLRKAGKEHTLINTELWGRIQTQFPERVRARLAGEDSQNESQLDERIDGVHVEAGGFREEYLFLLAQFKAEKERERQAEEEASKEAIRQAQEEEAQQVEAQLKADAELAKRLQEEEEKTRKKLEEAYHQRKKEAYKQEKAFMQNCHQTGNAVKIPHKFHKREISPIPGPSTTAHANAKRQYPQTDYYFPKAKKLVFDVPKILNTHQFNKNQQNLDKVFVSKLNPLSGNDDRGRGRDTPDSISDEYRQLNFRPIASAPKTPPKPNQNGSHGLIQETIAKSSTSTRNLSDLNERSDSMEDVLDYTVNECNAASPKTKINEKWIKKRKLCSSLVEDDNGSLNLNPISTSSLHGQQDEEIVTPLNIFGEEPSMILTGHTDEGAIMNGKKISLESDSMMSESHGFASSKNIVNPGCVDNAGISLTPSYDLTESPGPSSAFVSTKNSDIGKQSIGKKKSLEPEISFGTGNLRASEFRCQNYEEEYAALKNDAAELELSHEIIMEGSPLLKKTPKIPRQPDELQLQNVVVSNEELNKSEELEQETPRVEITEQQVLSDVDMRNLDEVDQHPVVINEEVAIANKSQGQELGPPEENIPQQQAPPHELRLEDNDEVPVIALAVNNEENNPRPEVPSGNLQALALPDEGQRRLSEEVRHQEELDLKMARRIQRQLNAGNYVEREYVTRRKRRESNPDEVAPAPATSPKKKVTKTKKAKTSIGPTFKAKSKAKVDITSTKTAAAPASRKKKTPVENVLIETRKSPRIRISLGVGADQPCSSKVLLRRRLIKKMNMYAAPGHFNCKKNPQI